MIRHNCGLCVAHTLHDAYAFIRTLQHRGRDATGIAAVGDDRIDVIKWEGSVDRVDLVDLHKIFPSPKYHTYMAHVRYATRGSKDALLSEAHPHVLGGRTEHNENHLLIRDCDMAAVHNGQVDDEYLKGVNRNLMDTGCDTEALLHVFRDKGEFEFLRSIPGAYTIAMAERGRSGVVVLRDRTGIKPGVLGWKDGKYCVTSEDIALRKNGAEFIEDLDCGAAYYFAPDGSYRKQQVVDPEPAHCFFEWNYIADRDTILQGIYVKRLRRALGETLAREYTPTSAHLTTYLPRSPEDAAMGYAKATGIAFQPLFYKLRGERAFQGPTADERKTSIYRNLYVLPHTDKSVRGRSVVVIDDSVVRGNNIRREKELLDEVGAGSVCHLNYTPPIGIRGDDGVPRGCMFGVDMGPTDDFLARDRTPEQINEELGLQIVYISPTGMLNTFERMGMPRGDLCTYCIGGCHPFKQVKPIEKV